MAQTAVMEKIGARLTAFYEARLKPAEDISVLLHDDARRKELSRRAWGGEQPQDVSDRP
jgi:hypothetical protein